MDFIEALESIDGFEVLDRKKVPEGKKTQKKVTQSVKNRGKFS